MEAPSILRNAHFTAGDLSALSNTASATTQALPPPTNLTATATSGTQINLSWTAPAGGPPIAKYNIFRGLSAGSLSQGATSATTTYSDSSLNPSTTYYYAVQAVDAGGDLSALSATASAATLSQISPPSNVTVTATSNHSVMLTWSAPASGPAATYYIYRGASAGSLKQIYTVDGSKTSFTARATIRSISIGCRRF